MQHLIADNYAMARVCNWLYAFGHWPVIVLTLVWLLRRHHDIYIRVAGAMLLSGAVGLVAFAAFPATTSRPAGERPHSWQLLQPAAFTHYAANPGLIAGWSLLLTLALFAATRNIGLRAVAAVLTAAMNTAVVLTGDHPVLETALGAALAVLSWATVGRFQGRPADTAAPGDTHPAARTAVRTGSLHRHGTATIAARTPAGIPTGIPAVRRKAGRATVAHAAPTGRNNTAPQSPSTATTTLRRL